MFEDIKKNWRTTLAGAAALAFAGAFLLKGEYVHASAIAVIGFGLLAGKDGLNNNSNP